MGERLASGRDADIYAHGPGLVLRRARTGRSMATEAQTMAYVRDLGYPVPAVDRVSDDGLELVMERIDGPTMVQALGARPWTIPSHGRTLADLHRRLHELAAPPWLAAVPCGEPGDRLLHLDLHPLNVILSSRGPVVIDWPNARAGHPDVDVALTWALVTGGQTDVSPVVRLFAGWGRAALLRAFLAGLDADGARRQLPAVVEWKAADPHMGPAEVELMRALARGGSRRRTS